MKWGCGWGLVEHCADKVSLWVKYRGWISINVLWDANLAYKLTPTYADAQEIVWLGSRQRFAKVYWLPVRMVAEWLRSLCPQHAGLTFEIMVAWHKSSIQNTTISADAQEIVQLMRELCFTEIHWTPVCMVAKWLHSSYFKHAVRCSSRRVRCPQRQGFDLRPTPQRHKLGIQDYNYQCWRTRNCLTNAWTMFHWNSLDASLHGYKLATQPKPRMHS